MGPLGRAPARRASHLPSRWAVLRGRGRHSHPHRTDDKTESQGGQRPPAHRRSGPDEGVGPQLRPVAPDPSLGSPRVSVSREAF